MKHCVQCGSDDLIDVDDIISEINGAHFVQKGRRCIHCGEEYIDEYESQRMINIAKRMGIWGEPIKLHRKLSKSARGTVLRIPTDIEKNLHLKGNEDILISKIGKRKILIEVE